VCVKDKMGTSEKFCLRWNDFEKNISGAFRELREDKDFFDVTLACDDDQMQAHKVILSACSPFFRGILRRNKHDNPLLYLKGVRFTDLVSVLNFMYHGEVNVAQEELNSFLAVAEDLKVKGLTQNNSDSKQQNTDIPPDPPNLNPRVRGNQTDPILTPKRPRPTHPSPVSKPNPVSYPPHPHDDIQEVVPIKVEPASIPQEPQQTRHAIVQQRQDSYSAPRMPDMPSAGVVVDPDVEYGEEYADYEGYDGGDGGYGGAGLDTSGFSQVEQDGNKDFVSAVSEVLEYDSLGRVWQCSMCWMSNKDKARVRAHAEVHFKGFVHSCPQCGVQKKTSTALRMHIISYHKNK